jgi:hypothetical protein
MRWESADAAKGQHRFAHQYRSRITLGSYLEQPAMTILPLTPKLFSPIVELQLIDRERRLSRQ